MIPLLLDRRPPYLPVGPAEISLLTLPVGATHLVSHLLRRIGPLSRRNDRDLLVLPLFTHNEAYRRRLMSSTSYTVRIVDFESLESRLADCEPSDYVMVVDAGSWPAEDFDLAAAWRKNGRFPAATHAVAVGAESRARESVQVDPEGRVRRVQRMYDGVCLPEVAGTSVFFSAAPGRSLSGVRFRDLNDLRRQLTGKGVLSRDLPVSTHLANLQTIEGILSLNELAIREAAGGIRSGFAKVGEGVFAAQGCRIDPGARLIGPVILHGGASIAAGATVVGPTVVGASSRVETGAVVAQALLAPESEVGRGMSVRRRVVAGTAALDSPPAAPKVEAAVAAPVGVALDNQVNGSASGAAFRVHGSLQEAVKRVMDVLASAVMLAVLWPLLVAVAIWIKVDSAGPVFFLHRRERRDGKEFSCVKFRTMTADAHLQQRELYECNEVDGPQFKLHNDPRVTSFGVWLRKYNIDELPQVLNVLAGQMSLVGPRPSPFRENQVCVPWRRARLSVRPGITGLWQICRSGEDGASGFHEWIHYDLAYVRHFSILLDLKILAVTVLSFGGRRRVRTNLFARELGELNEEGINEADEFGSDVSDLGRESAVVG